MPELKSMRMRVPKYLNRAAEAAKGEKTVRSIEPTVDSASVPITLTGQRPGPGFGRAAGQAHWRFNTQFSKTVKFLKVRNILQQWTEETPPG